MVYLPDVYKQIIWHVITSSLAKHGAHEGRVGLTTCFGSSKNPRSEFDKSTQTSRELVK